MLHVSAMLIVVTRRAASCHCDCHISQILSKMDYSFIKQEVDDVEEQYWEVPIDDAAEIKSKYGIDNLGSDIKQEQVDEIKQGPSYCGGEELEYILDSPVGGVRQATKLTSRKGDSCERDPLKVDHVCHACSYKVNQKRLLRIHQLFSCCELEHTSECVTVEETTESFHHKDTTSESGPSTSTDQQPINTHIKIEQQLVEPTPPKLKLFSCNECTYKSKRSADLKKHVLIHTEIKPFTCDQCDYQARHLSNLKTHMLTHIEEKSFVCDQCDYKTSSFQYLKKHKVLHSGLKLFTCDLCDYKSSQSSNLRRHILTHGEFNLYACDQCDYKATQFSMLISHKVKHTGQKPHACDQCKYKSTHLSSLIKHKVTHTWIKPYACDYCEYRTGNLSNLKNHILTHTGERPFACNMCDYVTTQTGALKTHKLRHSGVKPYACDQCDYKAAQLGNLKRHVLKHAKPASANVTDTQPQRASHPPQPTLKIKSEPIIIETTPIS